MAALNTADFQHHTLGEYVRERKYGEDFLNFYLVPMSSAVWSTPPELMLDFPAVTLLRFFHNHGFLGLHTQHPWLTVVNGAKAYVEKIVAPFHDQIRLRHGATSVRREGGGAKITDVFGLDRNLRPRHLCQPRGRNSEVTCRPRRTGKPAPPGIQVSAQLRAAAYRRLRNAENEALLVVLELPDCLWCGWQNHAFHGLLDEQFAGCF